MADKNYESQGQPSPNLHINVSRVGFLQVIVDGHHFTEGLVFLSCIFSQSVCFYVKFDAKWHKNLILNR